MKLPPKLFAAALLLCSCSALAFADSSLIISKAAATPSVESAVAYIQDALPTVTDKGDQIELFKFIGRLQQHMGLYKEAYESYSAAIALDTRTPNVETRLNAALCAIAFGEIDTAESVLDSVLSIDSESTEGSYAKIYAVWCGVLKAQVASQLERPASLFASFLEDESMKCVHPLALFSLWWLTGEAKYAEKLLADFPNTAEAAAANGKVKVLAQPYLLFIPRPNQGFEAAQASSAKSAEKAEKTQVILQQIGLFRDEANAANCVRRLKDAGFEPLLTKETRPSGTTYTIVSVRETDGITAQKLRNAGFECYPVYAEE